ncbi:methyltransferase domain-containing protein [Haloechinothrix sp. LS1_15]|nr:methyltransferase domain-containing protein [Haloechinothrix sp. LS1_15]
MRAELVTAIYEDYWRPGLGRVLKGPRGPSMAGEVELAVERLRLAPGHTVLDVACGTGRFTRAFGTAVGTPAGGGSEGAGLAVGLDGSHPMLARAVERTARQSAVAYLRGDAVALPLAADTVDALCCFAALHMFADPEAALDSFARTLKPGGRIVLLASGLRKRQPARTFDLAGGRLAGLRMFERGEVAELLSQRGFTEITQDFHGVAQIVAATFTR